MLHCDLSHPRLKKKSLTLNENNIVLKRDSMYCNASRYNEHCYKKNAWTERKQRIGGTIGIKIKFEEGSYFSGVLFFDLINSAINMFTPPPAYSLRKRSFKMSTP